MFFTTANWFIFREKQKETTSPFSFSPPRLAAKIAMYLEESRSQGLNSREKEIGSLITCHCLFEFPKVLPSLTREKSIQQLLGRGKEVRG